MYCFVSAVFTVFSFVFANEPGAAIGAGGAAIGAAGASIGAGAGASIGAAIAASSCSSPVNTSRPPLAKSLISLIRSALSNASLYSGSPASCIKFERVSVAKSISDPLSGLNPVDSLISPTSLNPSIPISAPVFRPGSSSGSNWAVLVVLSDFAEVD